MQLQIFAIYDSKANAFMTPFFSQTTGTAVRDFESAVNSENSTFGKYAADYTLFHLGEFDQSSAGFAMHETPQNMGLALTYLREPENSLERHLPGLQEA